MFKLIGKTTDANLEQSKRSLVDALIESMRAKGYIPVYDIDPQFSLEHIEGDIFKYKMTMYGAYVKEADKWSGITNGRRIPLSK